MSKFAKSGLTVNGDKIHLSVPFAKVNKEKRTVSGYATLDNVDSQGDVVTAEASKNAFARSRRNLREMHDKIAAGKIVDWREDEFFDPETKKMYKGIYVEAYISKGAPNTWEKVLDETLTGFSIGGEINEASNEFDKDAGRSVRFIKDYDLVELSLVDNPANQLANIFSIQKSANGSVTVTGPATEIEIESVFICNDDLTVIIKDEESVTCPECERKMENAGWFESGVDDRTERVSEIVTKFFNSTDAEATPVDAHSEGGVEMAKVREEPPVPEGKETEVVNPSEEFQDGEKIEGVVREAEEEDGTVDEAAGTEEEGAETPEEVQDDETEISKKIDELHDAVKDSLEKTRNETKEHVESLEKRLDEIDNAFKEKASELEAKMDEFGQKLETTKAHQAALEKSLDLLNSSGAFKKSADLDDEVEAEPVVQKSMWNGAFSGKKFSIDNHI
jgi:hypothetical protein